MVVCIDYQCPTCGGQDPDCPDCRGTGIVRLPAGTPVSFPKQPTREKHNERPSEAE